MSARAAADGTDHPLNAAQSRRIVRLVFFVALCNMVCLRASKVTIALFALKLGGGAFTVGVLIAMYSVFPMLLAVPAGRAADRFGARMPMLVGSGGIVVGLIVPFLFPALWALHVSAAVIGAANVYYNVTAQNLIGIASRGGGRTRNFSNYSMMLAIAGIIAPLAAGFLIDHGGHARTYMVLALVPLLPMIAIARWRGVPAGPAVAAPVRGNERLWRDRDLRRVLIASGVILTGIDLFQFYMPVYGHVIGLSASLIGVVLASFSVASFVVRVFMPKLVRRAGEQRVLMAALALGAATYLLFPFFRDPVLLIVVSFVLGLGLGCGQPLSMMLTYSRSPLGRSGEALGLRITVNNFIHIVAPLAFGSVASAFGMLPVFIGNALMLATESYRNRPVAVGEKNENSGA
jgi:MFS family permease